MSGLLMNLARTLLADASSLLGEFLWEWIPGLQIYLCESLSLPDEGFFEVRPPAPCAPTRGVLELS